jgi:hypothetical protein
MVSQGFALREGYRQVSRISVTAMPRSVPLLMLFAALLCMGKTLGPNPKLEKQWMS